jgi:hypothetical protein
LRHYKVHFANHTFRIDSGRDYYRLEREDGRVREIRRARQDEPVETPYVFKTERSIHPTELTSFHTGVWQAIWDMAA